MNGKSVGIFTKLEGVQKLEKTLYTMGIEPCPHLLEAGNLNTLPIDVYRFMVANNLFIYLSKLDMELNLIAIGPLRNCSGA